MKNLLNHQNALITRTKCQEHKPPLTWEKYFMFGALEMKMLIGFSWLLDITYISEHYSCF